MIKDPMPSTSDEAASAAPHRRWQWLALLAPLLAVTLALVLGYLWNEDFWWYLSTGRAVMEQGGIPQEDPFLYTPNEVGWVYHSWLWTVIIAALEGLAGLEGVVIFHAVLAALLITLVYTTGRTDRWGLINAALTLLVLLTLRQRLCGKAELATWVMLALFFRILEHPGAFTWKKAVGLGGLQGLWANLHGGYPLGIFLTLSYVVGGFLQERLPWARGDARRAERKKRGKKRRSGAPGDADEEPSRAEAPPWWLPIALFLVAVADPRMWRERLAPFGFAFGSETVQPKGDLGTHLILEWRSPFDPSVTSPDLQMLFFLGAGVGLISFSLGRSRNLSRLFLHLGMIGLGWSAVRHLGGLALSAALVGIANLRDGRFSPADDESPGPEPRGGSRRLVYRAACGLLAVTLLTSAVSLRVARPGFEAEPPERFFTTNPALVAPGAVDFLLREKPPGPLFNDYQLGSYLGAHLTPHYRVFIDPRVLDPRVVERYTRMVQSPTAWRAAEGRYDFRTVVLGHFSKTLDSPLGATLLQDPRWRRVYTDASATVFVRRAPGVQSGAGPLVPEDSATWPGVPYLEPAALAAPLAFLQERFLANEPHNFLVQYLSVLGRLGESEAVETLADRALAVHPRRPLLLRQRCAARAARGDLAGALEDCAAAHEGMPGDPQIAALYVSLLRQSGDQRRARDVLEDILDHHPQDPMLLRLQRGL